jgi:hypothetical protein
MPGWRPPRPEAGTLEERRLQLVKRKRKLREEGDQINRRLQSIERKRYPPKTIEEAIALIGRKRDRYWLSRVLQRLGKGTPVQEALDDATRSCFPSVRKEAAVTARSLTQIRKPEICQAIEDIFAACGFTLEDAVRSHIGHIKGEHTKQVVVGGEVVDLRMPPSFAALSSYQKLVLPAQGVKVQIEHSNMTEILKTIESDGVGEQTMRAVGEVIDVEPDADPDDVDPFEDEESDEEGEDDE